MKSLYLEEYDSFVRYYARTGTGDPIIFIPGLITPAIPLFFSMINHSQLRDRSVVLINYPGTGISEHIDFDYHPRKLAEIIIRIIDQEPLLERGFHIMGHSQGGTVGIYLAQQLGKRILSLIISEGNIFPGGGPGTSYIASHSEKEWVDTVFDQMITGWREKGKQESYHADLVAMQQQSEPVALYPAAYQLVYLDAEVWEILSTLSCNRHFIYGERNMPHSKGEAMPDTPLPKVLEEVGVKTHVVRGAGHMMMLDNLDGYTSVVTSILNNL